MGGGGKLPGEVYVVNVSATKDQIILTGDKFDPSYFKPGVKYVAFLTAYSGDCSGTDSEDKSSS